MCNPGTTGLMFKFLVLSQHHNVQNIVASGVNPEWRYIWHLLLIYSEARGSDYIYKWYCLHVGGPYIKLCWGGGFQWGGRVVYTCWFGEMIMQAFLPSSGLLFPVYTFRKLLLNNHSWSLHIPWKVQEVKECRNTIKMFLWREWSIWFCFVVFDPASCEQTQWTSDTDIYKIVFSSCWGTVDPVGVYGKSGVICWCGEMIMQTLFPNVLVYCFLYTRTMKL